MANPKEVLRGGARGMRSARVGEVYDVFHIKNFEHKTGAKRGAEGINNKNVVFINKEPDKKRLGQEVPVLIDESLFPIAA